MRRILTLLLLTLITGISEAKPVYQSHAGILRVVESFITETLSRNQTDVEIAVGRLDPRLRLAECDTQMQAFMPQGSRRSGNTTVGVRCTHDRPWSLFVPVRIKQMRDVVILRNNLSRGSILGHADLDLRRIDISSRTGHYFQDPGEVVGRVLTRAVRAGRQLQRHDIAAADIVQRGEQVTLVAETQGFAVRMQGKALTNGSRGELIRVKNVTSSRIIEGIVMAPGIVQVKM